MENGVEQLFQQYDINTDRDLISFNNYESLIFYHTFIKDKSGLVTLVKYYDSTNRIEASIPIEYDNLGRVKKRALRNYEYDSQGRISKTTEANTTRNYFYMDNSYNPDSIVEVYTNFNGTQTFCYTYNDKITPFRTLPNIVIYLDASVIMHDQNTVISYTHKSNGISDLTETFTCVYDSNGFLVEKIFEGQNKKFKYYYK